MGSRPSYVLVVDPEPRDRTLAADALELEGFYVEAAASWQEAREVIGHIGRPDVLVIDPDALSRGGALAGDEALDPAARIPVVVVTRGPTSLWPGAEAVLQKPVSADLLVRLVHAARRGRFAVPSTPTPT